MLALTQTQVDEHRHPLGFPNPVEKGRVSRISFKNLTQFIWQVCKKYCHWTFTISTIVIEQ